MMLRHYPDLFVDNLNLALWNKIQPLTCCFNQDCIPDVKLTCQNFQRERVMQLALDGAL
jgi:hypothetical protein